MKIIFGLFILVWSRKYEAKTIKVRFFLATEHYCSTVSAKNKQTCERVLSAWTTNRFESSKMP